MNILFVEDDLQLQSIMVEEILIEVPGVNITTANNGAQAQSALIKAQNQFDLVITDHNLGDMEGTELSRKIKEFRPDLKVILVSGHLFGDLELGDPNLFYRVINKLENEQLIKEIQTLANQA